MPTPMPLSIGAVRLVYPVTNPETGVTKDTIIHQLKAVPPNMQSEHMSLERWEHGQKWDRVVPGINMVIPWPEVNVPKFETHDADTPRTDVENRSFYYNLLSPPMPESVIDELRNKYSKFRTRHEPWYVAKMEAQANSAKRQHAMLMSMQTPEDEFYAQKQEAKAAKGEPELTDEMLEKLGQIMAQSKAASLEDAGLSEVTPGNESANSGPSPSQ